MQKMSIRRCSLCKSQANLFDSPRKPFQSQLKRLPPKANIWTTFSLAGHCTTLFSALEKNAAQPGKVGYQQKALIDNDWMAICVWVATKKMEMLSDSRTLVGCFLFLPLPPTSMQLHWIKGNKKQLATKWEFANGQALIIQQRAFAMPVCCEHALFKIT